MNNSRVSAVLGPTNTGKTWLAVDRMLGHGSGMIGFPLRLLARENYDRIVAARGAGQVALITGEEKIIPPNPKFFCCTVEAMPLSAPVQFMAVDEVQLAGDPERGHVFTDRLLRRRGLAETMVMGASTMAPLIRKLLPDAEIKTRARFSTLHYTMPQRLHRLPRRSAVVGFSAAQVYQMAERLKRRHGGTAVVMGALSPRTRNAQVEMYQAGEVDYLVATDAIGMGLNMDIDHVALASLYKYDGQRRRRLTAQEIAQIAGRAGRHMADGSFNTLADGDELTEDEIDRITHHEFEVQKQLYWRSAKLDFRTPHALLKSLDARPQLRDVLRLPPRADDTDTLAFLIGRPEITQRATSPKRVELLWECCQIPDFRQTLSEAHGKLVETVFIALVEDGRLSEDWIARQISHLDRTQGDIDALMARLAHIRTITYITHKNEWFTDARYWQGLARQVEDKLSDLLHERLTARFVDRRAAVLLRSLDSHSKATVSVRRNGEVLLDGHPIGRIEGLRFKMDDSVTGNTAKAAEQLAASAVAQELATRVGEITASGDGAFTVNDDGVIAWQGQALARLTKGESMLKPAIVIAGADGLDAEPRAALQARLEKWLATEMEERLGPLLALEAPGEEITGPARGIAFQLHEAGGVLWRPDVAEMIGSLEREQRQALYRAGVRFGSAHVYMPILTKPAAQRLIGMLWWLDSGRDLPAPMPPEGRMSHEADESVPKPFYKAISYPVYGSRAVRVDILDRLESALYDDAVKGLFRLDPHHANLLGVGWDEAEVVIRALGHRKTEAPKDEFVTEYDQKLAEKDAAEKAAREQKKALKAAKAGQLPSAAELAAMKRAAAAKADTAATGTEDSTVLAAETLAKGAAPSATVTDALAHGSVEADAVEPETMADGTTGAEADTSLDQLISAAHPGASGDAPEGTASFATGVIDDTEEEGMEAPAADHSQTALEMASAPSPEEEAIAAEEEAAAAGEDEDIPAIAPATDAADDKAEAKDDNKPEREIFWFRLRRAAHGANRGGHGRRDDSRGGDRGHDRRGSAKAKTGGKRPHQGGGKRGGGHQNDKRGGGSKGGAPLNNPFADLLKK